MQQKIPELTFEDFGADERIFPQAGELSAGQFAPALRRRRVRMKGFEPTLF
ncbi:MAG: hypothetical protein KH234_01185 [Subdoligranulum variabile]|nr:hypothetical protein [Subdoligranulum variabile]